MIPKRRNTVCKQNILSFSKITIGSTRFTLFIYGNYQYYSVNNYGTAFIFANGFANSISGKLQLTRNSADPNIYATYGSNIKGNLGLVSIKSNQCIPTLVTELNEYHITNVAC